MKKFLSAILIIITSSFIIAGSGKSLYNIGDYKIANDGKTNVTKEIQAVIDECTANGGGTVYFPTGTYMIAALQLKDNVYLELSAGAVLFGSPLIDDYTPKYTIYALKAKNFGIKGEGTINGNGEVFWKGIKGELNRPNRLLFFDESSYIRIEGIKIYNSPNWNMELQFCDFAWIDGITMISPQDAPNTDGIDPTSSTNIFISNSYFDLGDDVICPKSLKDRPTENLVITNCVMRSDDSAIKLGTRSEAPIRNCIFSNIVIKDTQYGLAFFAKDGGIFENIRFSNISIETALKNDNSSDRPSGSYAIFLDIEKRKENGPISYIKNVYFNDITINSNDGHILVAGWPEQKIENLYFSNINYNLYNHRTFEGSKKPRGVKSLKNKAINDYSDVPSNFTFAYVKNLNIDNLFITDNDASGKFERHMIWGKDLEGVNINQFKNFVATPNKTLAQFYFENSNAISVTSSVPTKSETSFIHLGENVKDVSITNNDLRKVSEVYKSDTELPKGEIYIENNRR
ncbi:MAG: glycosyl hydrolase family 28 protein [Melioribacteraceae bacterium]